MSPAAWIALSVFTGGLVVGSVRWMLLRLIASIDQLQRDVHGDTGPVARMQTKIAALEGRFPAFLLEEDFDVDIDRLSKQVERSRNEGIQREERILEALERSRAEQRDDTRDLRTEITGVHKRIDDWQKQGIEQVTNVRQPPRRPDARHR